MQKELDSLIETSDGKDATIKSLKDQIDAVQEEVAKANDEIVKLVGQLSDEQNSNNNLENQIAENESTIQTLNQNILELRKEIEKLIAENEQLKEDAAKVTYIVKIGEDINRPLELNNTVPAAATATYTEDENGNRLTCFKKDKPTAEWFKSSAVSIGKKLSLKTERDENNVEPLIVISLVDDDLAE